MIRKESVKIIIHLMHTTGLASYPGSFFSPPPKSQGTRLATESQYYWTLHADHAGSMPWIDWIVILAAYQES